MSVRAGKVLDRPLVGKLLDGTVVVAAAKKSYDSGANHALLAELGIRDGVCYRWGRQRAEWARGRVDEELTRQRWRIGSKFAEQKRWHGMGRAKYCGLCKDIFQRPAVRLRQVWESGGEHSVF